MSKILENSIFNHEAQGQLTEEQCEVLGLEYNWCEPLYYVKLNRQMTDAIRNLTKKAEDLCFDSKDGRPVMAVKKGLVVFKDHPDVFRDMSYKYINYGTWLDLALDTIIDIYYSILE